MVVSDRGRGVICVVGVSDSKGKSGWSVSVFVVSCGVGVSDLVSSCERYVIWVCPLLGVVVLWGLLCMALEIRIGSGFSMRVTVICIGVWFMSGSIVMCCIVSVLLRIGGVVSGSVCVSWYGGR